MTVVKRFYTFVRGFLKKIDLFGVPFSFKYNYEEKYTTCLGGIIFILFCIGCLSYFIINLFPFFKREIFTLQFYKMNLENTEEIKLRESKAAFAFGLTCGDDSMNQIIRELFNLDLQFYEQIKGDGEKISKIATNVTTHNCSLEDFYNLYNESFEMLNIKDLQCIDQNIFNDHKLKGIYTDELFTYYKFTVFPKNFSEDTFNAINNFLLENDCKLQFYYSDVTLNLSNFKEPSKYYINSLFLQLNPTLVQEKNIYFMNYHIFNESKLFHIFEQNDKPKMIPGFSRTEEYALYKGLNRGSSKSYDYEKYAKLYIRVDNQKIVIKRKYQDFMEFFADNSSLFIAIFKILCFIFSFYNKFQANHSITKKLFYFEGIENNKFEELKKIKELINSTEGKDIKIFRVNDDKNEKTEIEKSDIEKTDITMGPIYPKINPLKISISGDSELNITDINVDKNEKKDNKDKKSKNLIKYNSYNVYEMIGAKFPSCFKTKMFKSKESLINQSHKILDNKLDIFLYIRNMLLFDAISQIYFDNSYIFNFLSRPIIFLNKKKEKIDKNELYEDSNELNFDILYERIQKLCIKPEKTKIEQNLIFLLKQKLNEVK